jgi:hypothetical protein
MPTVTQLAAHRYVVAGRPPFVTRIRRLRGLLAFVAILSVVAMAAAPTGSAGGTVQTCGLPIAIQDPDIRAAFVRFARNQSPGAAKACAGARTAVAVAQTGR